MQVSFKFRTLEEESGMDRYARITNLEGVPEDVKNKVSNFNLTLVQIANALERNLIEHHVVSASKLEAEGPCEDMLSQAISHNIVFSDNTISIENIRSRLTYICHFETIARAKIEEYLRKYKEDSFRFKIALEYKEQYCPYEVVIKYDGHTKVNITLIAMLDKYYNIDLDKYKEITEIKSEYGA